MKKKTKKKFRKLPGWKDGWKEEEFYLWRQIFPEIVRKGSRD